MTEAHTSKHTHTHTSLVYQPPPPFLYVHTKNSPGNNFYYWYYIISAYHSSELTLGIEEEDIGLCTLNSGKVELHLSITGYLVIKHCIYSWIKRDEMEYVAQYSDVYSSSPLPLPHLIKSGYSKLTHMYMHCFVGDHEVISLLLAVKPILIDDLSFSSQLLSVIPDTQGERHNIFSSKLIIVDKVPG